MAITAADQHKSPINLKRLVIFPITAEDETTGITYGTGLEIKKTLMTATDTPATVSARNTGDGETTDVYVAVDGGQLQLGITALTSAERVSIYGEQLDNGTNVYGAASLPPYVGVAYMTERTDGTVNLKKYPKVRFLPQAETETEKKREGVTFATLSLTGEYVNEAKSGAARYVRYAVDPKTDKAVVDSWFTDGAYFKPTTTKGM